MSTASLRQPVQLACIEALTSIRTDLLRHYTLPAAALRMAIIARQERTTQAAVRAALLDLARTGDADVVCVADRTLWRAVPAGIAEVEWARGLGSGGAPTLRQLTADRATGTGWRRVTDGVSTYIVTRSSDEGTRILGTAIVAESQGSRPGIGSRDLYVVAPVDLAAFLRERAS